MLKSCLWIGSFSSVCFCSYLRKCSNQNDLDSLKLKTFADNKTNLESMMGFAMNKVENTLGRKENASHNVLRIYFLAEPLKNRARAYKA